ncbi:hypothetical protein CsSME_00026607 [Camellia sinensis var. sinensis]
MEKSVEEVHTVKALGSAARDHSGILSPFEFSRRYVHGIEIRFHYQPNKFQTITNET